MCASDDVIRFDARFQEVDFMRQVNIKHVFAEKRPNKIRTGGIVAITEVAAMGLGIASMYSQRVNDPNRSSFYLGYIGAVYGGVAVLVDGTMVLSGLLNRHYPHSAISVYGARD